MEITQVVGPHICGFCDDHISEHEVSTISNDPRVMFETLWYSWSTLLLPTLVQWLVAMSGTELDLGSVAFVNQLNVDINTPQANSGMCMFRSQCHSRSGGAQDDALEHKHLRLKPSIS